MNNIRNDFLPGLKEQNKSFINKTSMFKFKSLLNTMYKLNILNHVEYYELFPPRFTHLLLGT